MLITRRNLLDSPFDLLDRIDSTLRGASSTAFPVDIAEYEDYFLVEADVAGYAAEQVDVTLDQGVLTLEVGLPVTETAVGDDKASQEADSVVPAQPRVYFKERSRGHAVRRFNLGSELDPNAVEASLDSGVLTVRLPKKQDVKPRRIAVK